MKRRKRKSGDFQKRLTLHFRWRSELCPFDGCERNGAGVLKAASEGSSEGSNRIWIGEWTGKLKRGDGEEEKK